MKQLPCLRCNAEMQHLRREYLQLGKTGYLGGDWSNIRAGALDVDIYYCPECGKLEFYRAADVEETDSGDTIAQVKCPRCGQTHDMDYPKCPFCKHDYTKE